MTGPRIIHSDLEGYLVQRFRTELAARPEPYCQNVTVDNKEPSGTTFPLRLLVIRDGGGSDTELLVGERDVGLSVLAGTKENPKECIDLALMVHAIARDLAGLQPGNPIAAVLDSGGPYPVPEQQQRARRYIPITVAVVGRAL